MGKEAIIVRNLSISASDKKIISDVSFSIEKGSFTALVGESGVGKTITSECVLGMGPAGLKVSGEVILNIRKPSYVFQHPSLSLNPSFRINTMLRRVLKINGMPHGHGRTERILCSVGLSGEGRKYPHELSGGMAQRAYLALSLATNPDFLVADEITSSLDRDTEELILNLLSSLKEKRNLTVLFITHDLSIAKRYADRILIMEKDSGIRALTEIDDRLRVNLTERGNITDEIILDVKNIRKSFGSVEVLRGASFFLRKGERLGITGKTGAGKSLLMNIVARFIECSSGSVTLLGNDFLSMKGKELRNKRKEISYIIQDSYQSLDPGMSVEKAIREGCRDRDSVIDALERVGLDSSLIKRKISTLSGGERARVSIARAITMKSMIIIADEITSSLDRGMGEGILELLGSLEASIILISHDYELLSLFCDRIVILENGMIGDKNLHDFPDE